MKNSEIFHGVNVRVFLAITLFAICMCPVWAHADLIIGVQSVSVNASTTGNSLDLTLTNNGVSAITVAGFSFEVTTPSSNITFTSATIGTTNPYIFDGNSLFGPTISTATGQTLDGSDFFITPASGTTIVPNATFGLGHLFFDVGGVSGTFAVTLNPATSLSDQNGVNLPFDLSNGQIDIIGGTAVPEPSSMLLLATGVAALATRQRKLRRDI